MSGVTFGPNILWPLDSLMLFRIYTKYRRCQKEQIIDAHPGTN